MDARKACLEESAQILLPYYVPMPGPDGKPAKSLELLVGKAVRHRNAEQSARQVGKPAMDIQIIMKNLNDAKALIQSVMAELEKANT